MREALERIAQVQPDTLEMLRSNGIVFDGPLGTDPKNWQHVAFSLYTTICETDTIARSALKDADEDAPVLGKCLHGYDLDREFCPVGCRV